MKKWTEVFEYQTFNYRHKLSTLQVIAKIDKSLNCR